MSKITDKQVDEIISTLQGTCDTLDGAIQEICDDDELSSDDLTEDQHDKIANEIFLCDDCGWWCKTSEKSDIEDEEVCDECKECR